jgi:hypothetical protein
MRRGGGLDEAALGLREQVQDSVNLSAPRPGTAFSTSLQIVEHVHGRFDDLVEAPPTQNTSGQDRGGEKWQVENAAAGIATISPSSSSLLLAPRRTREKSNRRKQNRENSECLMYGMNINI